MKEVKEGTWDITDRTFEYALEAIRLYGELEDSKRRICHIPGRQYVRSATSIGANIEEAQSAESHSDFIHKMNISLKEARESVYWLRLLEKSKTVPLDRLSALIQEAKEIRAIIGAIVAKAKRNRGRKNEKGKMQKEK